MTTLADLKAQHPCIVEPQEYFKREAPPSCHEQALAALIAKAQEDEARINTLTEAMADYDVMAREDHARAERLVAILKQESAAEREAHEVTRKALEEVDREIAYCYHAWQSSGGDAATPNQSICEAALAREEARKKGKVPDAE